MFNSVFLIGRITDKPNIKKLESGLVVGNFVLAVNRPYKNADGENEVDFIPCTVWNSNATNMNEFCNKGSLIGLKGMLQMKEESVGITKDDGEVLRKNIKVMDIFVEKIIFLKL